MEGDENSEARRSQCFITRWLDDMEEKNILELDFLQKLSHANRQISKRAFGIISMHFVTCVSFQIEQREPFEGLLLFRYSLKWFTASSFFFHKGILL